MVFLLQNCERIFIQILNILSVTIHNNPIYQTRSTAKAIVKQTASRTVNFNKTFFPQYSQEWNNFSDDIKSYPSPISFKKKYSLVLSRPLNIPFLQFMTRAISLNLKLQPSFYCVVRIIK